MKKILSIILVINLITTSIIGINVIPGNKIFSKEQKYIKNRKPLTKAAIRQILKIKDKDIKLPKIDICLSGGGYRSMISSLGFINGAEKNNLFQATRYISALSGSTWLLIPLMSNKTIPNNYKNLLKKNLTNKFINSTILSDAVNKYKETKNKNAFISSWGKIISDHLLNGNDNLTMKTIRNLLKKTLYYPFPLFSCIIANSKDPIDKLPYNWLEISPYSTYSKILGGMIPTEHLGSEFKKGELKINNPELTTSFLMGMLGSPFCMSAGDILNFALINIEKKLHFKNYKYLDWFEKKFENLGLYKKHFYPAIVPNYSYGLKQSKLRGSKKLELIDGGFNFNLPMEALFRRKPDIIIICDVSTDATGGDYPELKLAAKYALNHDIHFPNLDKPYSEFENLKIFYNPNRAHIPMIIYFSNPIKDSTLKMQYSSEEFDILHNKMEQLVVDNTNNIADAIRLKTNKLNER